MHALAFVFALHFGPVGQMSPEHPSGDRWLSADKAKHFFTAAFVQSVSFSGLRVAGVSKGGALAGATVASSGISVGKELYDRKTGTGTPSLKDLTWDGAGILGATILLHHTER